MATTAVWAVGINHTTAPLAVRSRFAWALEQVPLALQDLRTALPGQCEAALVSTCNRVEIYGADDGAYAEPALAWLADHGGMAPDTLRTHAYTLRDRLAVRHAFRVASGLDSMVLGEPQILGQLKKAVRAARSVGTIGSTLGHLFERSFAVAKQVRSSTGIGERSISMAAAAVRMAETCLGDLQRTRILFIGAGDMIELCATHFAARRPNSMAVANRTVSRGEELARRHDADVMRLADLPERLHEFDIVVSCTASTLPIIGLGAMQRCLHRRTAPMFLLDLAVPRDIEPEVAALPGVTLCSVDDLGAVVRSACSHRQAALEQAEAIVDAAVQGFLHWVDQRGAVPFIQQVNAQSDAWRDQELAHARKLLARGVPVEDALATLTHRLSRKMLHGVRSELRSGDAASRERAAAAALQFFLRKTR
ncbi:glutamyl-tRNA reductase [Candidatus Symbiobacter mobilis]|uniref:Glutamyl-tRNA reductase n=1 Tax=Candidatus Symbiobacter mobilis CR TaxID=946483 RepID=U5N9E6_9BURK|nr:glutamyl-tRNA reductase [Candidatus Symbiobacter mobilis]AGX88191.1 glutamyl-tRNA reductase [Candidatus Symbiobacter mobilis CR]